MKIRPVGVELFELFHADGQTDITKLTVALRNFAKALKNLCILSTELRVEFICSTQFLQ
jgi:hypothetical protein